jgi:hypothetical protein
MSIKSTLYSNHSFHFGLGFGLVAILISLGVRLILPGRILGDPLPILLILSQLMRGITQGIMYIHWQSVLIHLSFISVLVLILTIFRRIVANRIEIDIDLVQATKSAIVVNVIAAGMLEIDSVMVGLWYLAAGYLSYTFAGVISHALVKGLFKNLL